ncbi:hypothetical protein QFZ79_000327 [Arthrobacter sp. V4I6]|uniref:hypothetical protein n=1 Tax=unclassified Arthrobacter TaxID=235627 RepID=UPI00277F1A95|nr:MULTISPECIES: hypothetical protein [unclassified Arthrobacter]MDQ0822588.1 hypothetical protein [Arthrobacter sp. V1I7]MDQ0852216.1 hypothetical protein [Arthrobacter sp. V4I6]
MGSNGSLPIQPARDSLESDPAYDYADDAPVDVAVPAEEEELLDEAERRVPLDEDDFLGDEQTVVPLDGDEFLEPDEEE